MGAITAGFLIFVHWIKRYGCFVVLWSDNASAYVSEVLGAVAQCLGVTKQVCNSLGGHSRFVERAQAVLSKVLYEAEKTGQVMSDDDLLLWISAAEMQLNQLDVVDRSTVFQRIHGQIPLTSRDLMAPSVQQAQICDMKPEALQKVIEDITEHENDSRLSTMQGVCRRLMGEHRIQQDIRARYSHARRLVEEGKKVAVDFKNDFEGIDVGQVVSYKGDKWVLLEMVGPQLGEPVAAVIQRMSDGVRKKVKFDLIRPLAVDRPVLVFPRKARELELLDAVVFLRDGDYQVAVVMEVGPEPGSIDVQFMGGNACKSGDTWLLVWECGRGERADVRKNKCPDGYVPKMVTVDEKEVVCEVYFDGNRMLVQESKNLLEAKGFSVKLFGGG
jgi:hypothetical protein